MNTELAIWIFIGTITLVTVAIGVWYYRVIKKINRILDQ